MKFLTSLLIVLMLAACGRFDFGSRMAQQGRVPVATFLSLEGASALGFGGCTPVTVKGWAQTGVPGGPRVALTLALAGLRAADAIFSDAACKTPADRKALPMAAGATAVTFYLRAGSMGQIPLEISSAYFETVRQAAGVELVATRLAFSGGQSTLDVPAGFCFGPIGFEVQDANGSAFTPNVQNIQLAGGEGVVFSDAACANAIPSAKITLNYSRNGTFYVRRSAVSASVPIVLKDPTKEYIATDSLGVAFVSSPFQVRFANGPATGRLPLGACDATPYAVELRDVEGKLSGPRSEALRVELGSADGTVVVYRTACGAMGSVITSLTFAPGESSKNVYLEARSRNSVSARAWVSGSLIQENRAVVPVDAVPLALDLDGPASVVAGSLSTAFSVALLDGLGAPIAAPAGGITINIAGVTGGVLCSQAPCASNLLVNNRLLVNAGMTGANFFFLPDPETASGSRTFVASAVNASLSSDAFSFTVGERVPAQLRISDGPGDGNVDLGVCETIPFNVELLDANGLAVDPAANTSVTVNLSYSVGAGQFRSTDCDGAAITQLTFTSGQTSRSIYITAQARNSVTLRAQSGSLTAATKSVAVTTVPVKLGLAGPTRIRGGVVAGPYTLSLQDGLSAPISAGTGGVTGDFALPSAVKGSYCLAASCATQQGSLSLDIPSGQSSATFYLLSDADGDLSNQSLTATPDAANLQPASLALTVSRDTLSVDPAFGSSGRVTSNLSGFDGGEILSSVYVSGKVAVAGFQTNGSAKRFAVGRYRADRSQSLGVPDTGFNGNGFHVLNLGEESWASAVAVQGANLLVAGVQRTAAGGSDIVLVRIRDNGTPDPAFRMSGGVPVPLELPGEQFASALLVGGDGTIYVVGYADAEAPSTTNTSDFFVAAFASNGTALANGVAYLDVNASEDIAKAAVLQEFGGQDRITIGGTTGSGANHDVAVARVFGVRGVAAASVLTMDPSFNGGSPAVYDWGSLGDTLEAMAVQPSGRVIAVGARDGVISSQIALMGLTSNGGLDGNFGSNGLNFQDIGLIANERLYAVAADPATGVIYSVGIAGNDLLAVRYGADGRADGLSPANARFTVNGNPAEAGRSIVFGQDSKPLLSGAANGNWTVYQLLR